MVATALIVLFSSSSNSFLSLSRDILLLFLSISYGEKASLTPCTIILLSFSFLPFCVFREDAKGRGNKQSLNKIFFMTVVFVSYWLSRLAVHRSMCVCLSYLFA